MRGNENGGQKRYQVLPFSDLSPNDVVTLVTGSKAGVEYTLTVAPPNVTLPGASPDAVIVHVEKRGVQAKPTNNSPVTRMFIPDIDSRMWALVGNCTDVDTSGPQIQPEELAVGYFEVGKRAVLASGEGRTVTGCIASIALRHEVTLEPTPVPANTDTSS